MLISISASDASPESPGARGAGGVAGGSGSIDDLTKRCMEPPRRPASTEDASAGVVVQSVRAAASVVPAERADAWHYGRGCYRCQWLRSDCATTDAARRVSFRPLRHEHAIPDSRFTNTTPPLAFSGPAGGRRPQPLGPWRGRAPASGVAPECLRVGASVRMPHGRIHDP